MSKVGSNVCVQEKQNGDKFTPAKFIITYSMLKYNM